MPRSIQEWGQLLGPNKGQVNADSSGIWKSFRGTEPDTLQKKDNQKVDTSMYEIKTAGAKGLGVFATTFIPRGTRIFSERPLLAIKAGQDASDLYTSSRCLSPQDQQRLMRLSFYVNRELKIIRWSHALWYTLKNFTSSTISSPTVKSRQSIFDHVSVLNIFRSNSFNIGSGSISQALFSRISRINHSCIPNAQGNYHEEQGKFNVHATRDINIDEEVSINYLPENGFVRSSRQDQLLSGYGFSCRCPACDMASLSAQKGEADRAKFHENLGNAREELNASGGDGTQTELSMTKSFIELLEGQNITGRELSSLYLAASRLEKKLGGHDDALRLAEKALEIEQDCVGTDHQHYKENFKVVQELKRDPMVPAVS